MKRMTSNSSREKMPPNQTDGFFCLFFFGFLQSHNLQQQKLAPISTCLSNALNDDSKKSQQPPRIVSGFVQHSASAKFTHLRLLLPVFCTQYCIFNRGERAKWTLRAILHIIQTQAPVRPVGRSASPFVCARYQVCKQHQIRANERAAALFTASFILCTSQNASS